MTNMEEGQKILLVDLIELEKEVVAGEFGDFSNEKYPAPKVALVQKLEELKQNVINGKYD